MYRSCPLIQHFAKQGLKIRVRKDCTSRTSTSKKKLVASHDNSQTYIENDNLIYTHQIKNEDTDNTMPVQPNHYETFNNPENNDADLPDDGIEKFEIFMQIIVLNFTFHIDKVSKRRRLSLSYLLENHSSHDNLAITLPPPSFNQFSHKNYSLYYRDTKIL